MELLELIRNVEIFKGLTEAELVEIVSICSSRKLHEGDILVEEGEIGEEFFLITEGTVEVIVGENQSSPRSLVHLGAGQLIGEMAMVDQGRRSATLRALESPTKVQVIRNVDFQALCERSTKIGYIVMRNMAADLSFKLRHLNLIKGS